MTTVSVRDLRNHGGEVLDSVARGESVTVTRQGKPIAELRPIPQPGTPASTVLTRWRGMPVLDLDELRADLDALIDSHL